MTSIASTALLQQATHFIVLSFFTTLFRSEKSREKEVTEVVLSIDMQEEFSRCEKDSSQPAYIAQQIQYIDVRAIEIEKPVV